MVIENDGAPEDRRVWDESRTLSAAGWDVVRDLPPDQGRRPGGDRDDRRDRDPPLSAPAGRDDARLLPGVRAGALADVAAGHRLQRKHPFDVVHLANPPDFMYLATRGLARPAR